MSSRFIHTTACARISFLLKAGWYSIAWLYHILFTHSSALSIGCLYPLPIVVMLLWTWMCKYFSEIFSVPLGMYLEVEFLDHMVILFLIFWGTTILFFIVVVSFYNPIDSAQGFPFLFILTDTVWNTGDTCLIPGSGRSPGEGNRNPLQYSCLENSMDRGAWQATVHGVTKSWAQLSD